jgi:inner membrane protein
MENNTINTVNSFWERNRIILKGFLITALVILLLIPTFLIQGLINEREGRQHEAVAEVSSKWANAQTVTGPVISIPYLYNTTDAKGNMVRARSDLFFLPSKLDIQSKVVPEERKRGIYKVIVYTSQLQLKGRFPAFDVKSLNVTREDVLWNEASVFFDVSDVRGLKEEVMLNWLGSSIGLAPAKFSNRQFKSSLSAALPLNDSIIGNGGEFSLSLDLKGSEDLQFVPVGKETSVNVQSKWPDPSFNGNFLPDERVINDSGFSASWKVLYLNRNYPQQWKDATYELEKSSFGVSLLVPVDAYQKSSRSVKYAILCILLTFTAFLLIELIYNKVIHSLQYVLVGFALCIFYTLLLSISEYIVFNAAYLIAAIATIALITLYVKSILQSGRMALFIGLTLTILYGFMFVLIQSQDYALLMGSVGLFIIIALVMYFSRRIRLNQ